MILSFARGFHVLRDRQRKKEWRKYFEADEIQGKTVGILGLGNIGRVVAHKCKLLGMRVVALDIQAVEDRALDRFYPVQDAIGLLQESDYVVITLPLTPDTHHLVGEKHLRAMKKTACLINVARGKIVDEQALITALKGKMDSWGRAGRFRDRAVAPRKRIVEFSQCYRIAPYVGDFTLLYGQGNSRFL